MNIWLDDERDPSICSKEKWVWVKTLKDFIKYCSDYTVSQISLDHDLGETDPNHTGYDAAKWIEEQSYYGRIKRMQMHCHSANPTGRKRIEQAFEKAREYWDKQEK